jgi:hypothetical protein
MRILYLGWFTSLFILILLGLTLYKIFILNMHLPLADIMLSILIGYAIGVIINAILLTYLEMDIMYTVTGIFDAIWKKFYWVHGAKLQGFLMGQFLYYMLIYDYDFKKSFFTVLMPFFI